MKKYVVLIFVIFIIICIVFYRNNKVYYLSDFNVETIKSDIDCNQNGIDDYTDIVIGSRINLDVKYKSAYYNGGYPPNNEGVCTDVIWRAFANAGYILKDLVDVDIKLNKDDYRINIIDSNIDFRRVSNLKVFFERNSLNLTLDANDVFAFQPGDIVTFADEHIAIISDKRNKNGEPYLIHNANQLFKREDNTFKYWVNKYGLSGHFRWENNFCNRGV